MGCDQDKMFRVLRSTSLSHADPVLPDALLKLRNSAVAIGCASCNAAQIYGCYWVGHSPSRHPCKTQNDSKNQTLYVTISGVLRSDSYS